MSKYSLTHLSDGTLLRDLTNLVARDRTHTAELLAHLAEVDARSPSGGLSIDAHLLRAGTPSLRGCREQADPRGAEGTRIPALFGAIANGWLNLSGVILLASHLTPENADELIKRLRERARPRSRRSSRHANHVPKRSPWWKHSRL
jgi:hypothetical protein